MESPLENRSHHNRARCQGPAKSAVTVKGKERLQVRCQKVRESGWYVISNVQEIAKRTLATHRQQPTEAEQQEFILSFTEFVQKTYSGILDRYTTNVQFFYDQERIDDKFAEVDILCPSTSSKTGHSR